MSERTALRRVASQDWFAGRWGMQRLILNVPDKVVGEFWGEAEFLPDDQGLTCRESGVLRFEGQDFQSGRVLLFRFPKPGRVSVAFEDGREFHEFDVARPEAVHTCDPDVYMVHYRFESDSWETRWEVHGPKKDYVMETRYSRR